MNRKDFYIPVLGPSLPRRGNRLTLGAGRLVLRTLGWRLEGVLPDEPKLVAIGAPHTSNWDFIIAMATMFTLGVRISWMGKHSLFVGPIGVFMRWLGGLAIDRRAPRGSVAQVIEAFKATEKLIVAITPEGTRRAVTEWRTGFYRIADGAGVPILPIALDWQQKIVHFDDLFWPTGEVEADMERIKGRFREVPGKFPHAF